MSKEGSENRTFSAKTGEMIYFISRVETLIEENKMLKVYVDELRQESSRRKGIYGFMLGALGVVGAAVGWLLDNALRYSHTGNFQ